MKKTIASLAALATLALASSAPAATGDLFSFALQTDSRTGTSAPAFPAGPDARAWWAGTCDLDAANFAVGADPGYSLAHCIDHPPAFSDARQLQPPLSPGLTSGGFEGWATEGSPKLFGGPAWRLADVTQAGAHPDGSGSFWFSRDNQFKSFAAGTTGGPDGAPRSVRASLPPGVLADPGAVPQCPSAALNRSPTSCPPQSQVGVSTVSLGGYTAVWPVYNAEPRDGKAAELIISGVGISEQYQTNAPLVASVRSGGDFGVDVFANELPAATVLHSQTLTIWGVPWAESHDRYRPVAGYCHALVSKDSFGTIAWGTPGFAVQGLPGGLQGGCSQNPVSYEPSWGPIKPFFTTQTECSAVNPVTRIEAANYHTPVIAREGSVAPPISGCEDLSFPADIVLDPTTIAADSPSGLDVELTIPQNNEPPPSVASNPADASGAPAYWKSKAGLATAHLKDTVVTLPAGFSINPSAANGQEVCSSQQIGLTSAIGATPITFSEDDPHDLQGAECPEAAKIGTVMVETPLLEEADWPTGEVYLAAQNDNPFGSNYALYIVLRSVKRGLTIKIAGKVEPDPATGQIVTRVSDNPQLPFDRFTLHFKGGAQAALATSPVCGTGRTRTSLAPYSDPANPVVVEENVVISQEPNGAASCPTAPAQRPFKLGFAAGSTKLLAGQHSPFTLRVQRPDGNQELDRIELTTPEGLVAKLAGIPSCSESGIARATSRTASGDGAREKADPSCPAASQVGTTTIGAGAGLSPYYVSGKVYLAGPYKGAPVSLAFVVPAVAGPFDLGVQVVRTALQVNPKTAQVTAVSDTIPKILAGVPLRIRDIRVDLDRDGFTLNPTDCSEQHVTGRVFGASGAVAPVDNRFQVAECAQLGFKPKLKLQLKGSTKRGGYPALKATLTARPGDANIARASVALPHSEFLAQEHLRNICTRVRFAAHDCPAASVYGRATAISPLLDQPLTGPVYLRSSDNPLPDLVAALRGPDNQPIEIELSGRTDSKNEGIRNTFDIVPDAPVSKFTLEMQGGKKGLLLNSTNICKGTHKATVKFDAQNGREHDFSTPVAGVSCGKGKAKGKKVKQGRVSLRRSLANLVPGAF